MRKKRILVSITLSIIILCGICLLMALKIKEKDFISLRNVTIELGDDISSNIKDYVDGDITKYDDLVLDNKNIKSEVGKYEYSIKAKRKVLFKTKTEILNGTFEVVDTTKPELSLKNVSINIGDELDINSFIENCTDLSNCQVKYKNEEYVNSIINIPGKYEILIIGYDDYNNEIEASTNLEIKEKVISNNNQSNKQKETEGVAVLNYHFTINEEEKSICEPSSICMDENLFEQHIKYIVDNGFYTATLKELEDYIDGKKNLPKKTVVITIDDGWFVARAKALIEKYNVQATLFLIGSLAPVSAYASSNLEVHSHTWNLHGAWGSFINADDQTILEDLAKSRESLDNTRYFCYPFYQYDNRVISLLKQAGFTMALAGDDRKAQVGCNKYVVPRFVINSDTSVQELANIIN